MEYVYFLAFLVALAGILFFIQKRSPAFGQSDPPTRAPNPRALQTWKEQLFVEDIIALLSKHPEQFSAKWFNGRAMDSSVMYKPTRVLISLEGKIFSPIDPLTTKEQSTEILRLIAPIIERDKADILNKLLGR